MTELNKEYAEALYALATEAGEQETWLQALETAVAAVEAEPAYGELLASPAISTEQRDTLLADAFGQLLPNTVLSYIQLMCAKGHSRYLKDSVADYRRLYETAMALSTAHVSSAVPLSAEQAERLRRQLEQLSGRTVQLDCTVDKSLLGGITVELDGKVLDGSLKRRLHDVKEVMEQ